MNSVASVDAKALKTETETGTGPHRPSSWTARTSWICSSASCEDDSEPEATKINK